MTAFIIETLIARSAVREFKALACALVRNEARWIKYYARWCEVLNGSH